MRTPDIPPQGNWLRKKGYRCLCSNSISRRLLSRGFEGTVLTARGLVARTPYFLEWVLSGVDSGRVWRFRAPVRALTTREKDGKSIAISERFTGQDRGCV